MEKTINPEIKFDFTPFFDHYPSGLVISTGNSELDASFYIDSDSAKEMLDMLKEWVDDVNGKGYKVDWQNTKFLIEYRDETIFAPVYTITFLWRDSRYNSLRDLADDFCTGRDRTDKEIMQMLSELPTV